MKIRNGFVSNSSSTAFIITNLTDSKKDLVDFVKENPQIIKDWIEEYGDIFEEKEKNTFTQENLIKSAQENNIIFTPSEKKYCSFGDEDGTLIGHVFDYMLRYEQESKSFKVKFKEWLR